MKKKWKNLIVLCLAATLTCFLPVRIAEAVEEDGNPSSEEVGEITLPNGENGGGDNNPPSGENGEITLLTSGGDEDNDSGEELRFVGIEKGITYLGNTSFKVEGDPTTVTIKEKDGTGAETELTAVDGTYTISTDNYDGTYIITTVKKATEEGEEDKSCTITINISKQKEISSSGAYALKKGEEYKPGAKLVGKPWKVAEEKNSTVYYGNCSFYVREAGVYHIE